MSIFGDGPKMCGNGQIKEGVDYMRIYFSFLKFECAHFPVSQRNPL